MGRKTEPSRVTKQTTYDEFLAEARRLRGLADAAEAEFLAYLYEGERVPNLWAGTGYTFIQFLKHTQLCSVKRYLAYKDAREDLGLKAITGVGVHAVIEAGRQVESARRREIIQEARVWEKTNGAAISADSARRLRAAVVQPPILPRKPGPSAAEMLAAANAEIERLRAENTKLREENTMLRAENEQLRAAVPEKRRSRKPARQAA